MGVIVGVYVGGCARSCACVHVPACASTLVCVNVC